MIVQPFQPFQPMPQPRAVSPVSQGGINWVQGEAGANAAFVPYGGTGVFFDSGSDRFFMKSVDPTGRPLPLKKYRYEEITEPAPGQEQSALTRAEVQQMIDQSLAALVSAGKEADNGEQYSPADPE